RKTAFRRRSYPSRHCRLCRFEPTGHAAEQDHFRKREKIARWADGRRLTWRGENGAKRQLAKARDKRLPGQARGRCTRLQPMPEASEPQCRKSGTWALRALESSYRHHIDAPMVTDICLKFARDTCGN